MHRWPAGLTLSALIAAFSIGALTLFGGLGLYGGGGPERLVHTAAGLCLLWSAAAYFIHRRSSFNPTQGSGVRDQGAVFMDHGSGSLSPDPWPLTPWLHDALAVLQIAMIITGLLVVIVMLYCATVEVLSRTVYFPYSLPPVNIWPPGLIDLAAVMGALVLIGRRNGHAQVLTAGFWVLVFAGLWGSLLLPAQEQATTAGYPVPGSWAGVFMLASALAIGLWTLLEGRAEHRRRVAAWPDALDHLVHPSTPWPGFHYSAGVVGVLVMVLGCIHLVVPWTSVAAFTAGGSLLALVGRKWNENLSDAGLALITLGAVSLCMLGFQRPIWSAPGYAAILSRALLGLAVMTAFWHWLIAVWKQQLDGGEPWTTAGRLVHTLRRVAFLVCSTAVLISIHLAIWPDLSFVIDRDDTPARWAWGLSCNALLFAAIVYSFWNTRRTTLAWLAVVSVASTATFALIRAPDSRVGQWWALHWPVGAAAIAAIALLLAAAIRPASALRALREPLIAVGVLIGPMAAMVGVSIVDAAAGGRMAPWVPAVTFGCMTGVYLLAALVPGPRTFAAVGVLCALVGLWHLRHFFS